ncbi:type I secretion C-terminal target domain-containing protein [Achromobacter anxifer]
MKRRSSGDNDALPASRANKVKDASIRKPAYGGDILDIQGLLVGEDDGSMAADQTIVLENVDLAHDAYGQFMNNQASINDLLQKGKLNVDRS